MGKRTYVMRFHHVGVVVASVEEQAARMQELFGFDMRTQPVVDPLQQVRVAFINTNTDATIELIEPLNETSPVTRFLTKGGYLNHLCYVVADLEAAVDHLRKAGSLLVCEPTPAAAFQGRRIAFLYTRDRQLVELLEEG